MRGGAGEQSDRLLPPPTVELHPISYGVPTVSLGNVTATDETLTYPGARRPDRRRRRRRARRADRDLWWGDLGAPADHVLPRRHGLRGDVRSALRLCSPTQAGGSWRGTSVATATPTTRPLLVGCRRRDDLAVLDSTTVRRCLWSGHSKGGGLMMQLAEAMPHRVSHLAQPRRVFRRSACHGHREPRAHPPAREGSSEDWLDHRRRSTDALSGGGH